MSITVIKEGGEIRIIESQGDIPSGCPIRLFTEEESRQRMAQRVWASLPAESREGMLMQTQSASYQEWMDDDAWDHDTVHEPRINDLPLTDFQLGTTSATLKI